MAGLATIPTLVLAGITFVPLDREIPADLDPSFDCKVVIERIAPAFAPAALVIIDPTQPKDWWTFKPSPLAIFNCTLIEEPCGRGSKEKCRGGEWVR